MLDWFPFKCVCTIVSATSGLTVGMVTFGEPASILGFGIAAISFGALSVLITRP